MDQYLKNIIKTNQLCGLALSYCKDNKPEHYYYGNKSFNVNSQPIDRETLFDCASLTKVVVTNTLILKLIEENKITLKDYVKDHLPEYRHPKTTISDLLLHTSGLPADSQELKQTTCRQSFKDKLFSISLIYQPGEKIVYSDLGYIILGFLIEKFYGNLETAAQTKIFEPLGMHHTFFNVPQNHQKKCVALEYDYQSKQYIQGVVHDEKTKNLGGVSGAAGLFSTLEDLEQFVIMLLDDDETVLKKSSKKQLSKIFIYKEKVARTLGFIKRDHIIQASNVLYHTGFTGTSLYINLDTKDYFILLSNRIHPHRYNDNIFTIRKDLIKAIEYKKTSYILASQSPRRKELFSKITHDFKAIRAEIEESFQPELSIEENLKMITYNKAKYVQDLGYRDEVIIAADTVIIKDGQVIGKPNTKAEASQIIKKLQGSQHRVKTAVCILQGDSKQTFIDTSQVSVLEMDQKEIEDYLNQASYLDKSGAYGIQEEMALYINHIEGDFNSIMGLPIARINKILKANK